VNLNIEQFPPVLQPLLRYFHIDFKPRTAPRTSAVALATLVAIVGSLVADWLCVKVGVSVFPGQRHYQHFQFADYSKLTIIGVLIACAGWPIVARISSQATWLFLRLAVIVTLVLLLPDAAIWYLGQPAAGVFVLVWMHIAIAVVTYLSLITIAPVRSRRLRR
jgi:hypothetical protein